MKGARRIFSSLNVVTTLLLLGVLFVLINYVSSRRYLRWDLSRSRITSLSDQTRQALITLTQPLSVIVFYQPSHRLYQLVSDQLKEYERANPNVKVEFVDPDQDIAKARQLVKEFQIDVTSPDALNLVIFQSGARHKYLSDTDLAEYDYSAMGFGGEPRVKAFKGEAAFTSAILSVTQASQPLIWMTSGHGEKSLDAEDPAGLSDAKKSLEQQNMSAQTVTLLERTEIPPEITLVVVAGPTRRFTEQEVALLEAYLQRGGSLLALIDPLDESGLDGLLRRWGIELGMDIVVDPARQLPFVSAANLFVTDYTEHPIVAKMKTLMTLFPLTRSVRPVDPAPSGLAVTPLALTSDAGWGETNTADERFQFTEGQDLKGPASIAAAAERDEPTRTRVVAVGDSDFLINAQLGNVGNRDFLLGAVYWLTEQERLIGIGPKPIESIKLRLTGGQLKGLFWFSVLAMPLACGAAGLAMWFLRRR